MGVSINFAGETSVFLKHSTEATPRVQRFRLFDAQLVLFHPGHTALLLSLIAAPKSFSKYEVICLEYRA